MMSERAFERSDIAVVGCIPVSRDGWQKEKKKVWEKFAAFVVKCREARKHQESRRQ